MLTEAQLSARALAAVALLALSAVSVTQRLDAEELSSTTAGDVSSDANTRFNVESRTFGGKQFWTDQLVFHDWRIQRHCLTGHCRLVDDRNVRRAWGKFDECMQVLDRCKQEQTLPSLRRTAIIVLHGLVRSRESMDELVGFLKKEEDFSVLNVSYASSRGKVSDHAAALAGIVENLPGVEEVHFVGHSLGNIVVRNYLNERANGVHGDRPVPKVGRIVMLGPPNQGAEMARRFQDNAVFKTVWGLSGRQLATEWNELERHLAVPQSEFGIIAGGRGDESGLNPLIDGDDDFVVSVEETKLPGASDFLVCPVYHGTIMEDEEVQKATLSFIRFGYFISADRRNPLPAAQRNE